MAEKYADGWSLGHTKHDLYKILINDNTIAYKLLNINW